MFDKFLKYSLIFLLVACSGIPFFTFQRTLIVLSFFISLISFLYFKQNLKKELLIFLSLFLGVELLQDYFFGNFSLNMHISTAIKLCTAFFITMILRINLIRYYVNLITVLCIISLVFFIGESFFNIRDLFVYSITDFFNPFERIGNGVVYSPNILVYTFNPDTLGAGYFFGTRNSGPFYEPGAFAIFIVLAFMFNIFISKNLKHNTNIILAITLFTTFSTAGYIAFFSVIASNFLLNSKIKYRIPLLIAALFGMHFLYFNLSIMKEKIEDNIELAEITTASRFGSANSDLSYIRQRPIFGFGKNITNIYGKSEYDLRLMHRNNGLTKLIVNYGIVIFFIYMLMIYKTLNKLTIIFSQQKLLAAFLFISIIALGFSQSIFNYTLFYIFLFMPKPLDILIYRQPVSSQ